MINFLKKNREKLFNFSILVIYMIITLICVINHESYEDEAQRFLISRDLSFTGIISQMRYEGHSPLWYLILAPFTKLGLSIQFQSYISWICCVITVYLILTRAPFSKLLKVFFIFSSGLLYFYSVIAGPYCMIPLFLVLIAINYKNKDKHPYRYAILLVLLANTHLVMLPTVGMLGLSFWGKEFLLRRKKQNKNFYLSALLAILGIGIYVAIVFISLKYCRIVGVQNKTGVINSIIDVIKNISYTVKDFIIFLFGTNAVPTYGHILFAFSVVFCAIGLIYEPKQGIVFWIHFICNILLHAFSWFILMTRVCTIIYTLMLWIWIIYDENEKEILHPILKFSKISPSIAAIILISISFYPTVKMMYQDVTSNFTTGNIIANYINENLEPHSKIICLDSEMQQSVISYLPKNKYTFYLPSSKQEFTYITWDDNWFYGSTQEEYDDAIKEELVKNGRAYIMYSEGISSQIDLRKYKNKELINTTDEIINSIYVRNEIFSIYEIDGYI